MKCIKKKSVNRNTTLHYTTDWFNDSNREAFHLHHALHHISPFNHIYSLSAKCQKLSIVIYSCSYIILKFLGRIWTFVFDNQEAFHSSDRSKWRCTICATFGVVHKVASPTSFIIYFSTNWNTFYNQRWSSVPSFYLRSSWSPLLRLQLVKM